MFRREVITDIDIGASSEEVWRHLTDFASYPEWNPFFSAIEGELRPGAALQVKMNQPGGKETVVRFKIKAVEPGRRLVWLGRTLLPWLLENEHSFVVEDREGGTSRLVQSETFTGFLALFLPRVLGEQTKLGFEMLNEVLKERAEGGRQKGATEMTPGRD